MAREGKRRGGREERWKGSRGRVTELGGKDGGHAPIPVQARCFSRLPLHHVPFWASPFFAGNVPRTPSHSPPPPTPPSYSSSPPFLPPSTLPPLPISFHSSPSPLPSQPHHLFSTTPHYRFLLAPMSHHHSLTPLAPFYYSPPCIPPLTPNSSHLSLLIISLPSPQSTHHHHSFTSHLQPFNLLCPPLSLPHHPLSSHPPITTITPLCISNHLATTATKHIPAIHSLTPPTYSLYFSPPPLPHPAHPACQPQACSS